MRASSESGATFYVRYKHDNQTRYVKLGRTTELTLAEARKRAKQVKAEIQLGADPRGEAIAQKQVPTLSQFFDEQYLPYARVHKRSWKRDVELFARLRPVFGHQRMNAISRQRVQQFHASLVEEGGLKPASADHVTKFARRLVALALEWQVITGVNPLSRIQMFRPDNRVDNHLDNGQLTRLMAVLETDRNRTVCLICKWLLATGCRLNEGLSATWNQIDRENWVWKIPAANSKSRRIRSVPLTKSAREVLSQLSTEGRSEYLFVNARTRTRYRTVAKQWQRLKEDAGLPHVRLHDLRHTFASQLVNAGQSLYAVQKLLGHSSPTVTERYSHLNLKTLHEAANVASIAMQEAKPKVA